jgi:hypothetical protein
MSVKPMYYGFHGNDQGVWTLERVDSNGRVLTICETFDKAHVITECERLNKGLAK